MKKLKILVTLLCSLIITTNITQNNAWAQDPKPEAFSMDEVLKAGHSFFDATTSGLAYIIEENGKEYGLPNAYILGEEGSGAFAIGVRYGEGKLYTKNNEETKVFWQGPSLGWDFGADGNKTMILVYNLHETDALYRRFPGVSGSAFFVGGLGMTVMKYGDIVLVPVRSGVGARLGINVGYLKVRDKPTWNPF